MQGNAWRGDVKVLLRRDESCAFFNVAHLAKGSLYNVGVCSCWRQATCFEGEVLDCTALKYYKCQTGSKSTFGHFVRDVLQKSVVLLLMRNTTGDRPNSKAVGFLLENWEKHDCTQHDKKCNQFGLHSFLPRKWSNFHRRQEAPRKRTKWTFLFPLQVGPRCKRVC